MIRLCNKDTQTTYCDLFKEKINAMNNYLLMNRPNRKLSDQSIRFLARGGAIAVKNTKKITPHVFRHTFATLLPENDADIKYIQTLLGQSSITTTQIYTQVNLGKQKRILTEMHPRMGYSMALE